MAATMKPTNKTASAAHLLPALASAIQALHRSGELEVGQEISLRCPCGGVILPPILVHENVRDRQRGLLKAKVERHLREQHGVSRFEISRILRDSFATI